jgi:hypothetical protein
LSETDEEWLLVFLIFLFGRGNIATIQYEKEIRSRDGKKNIQQDIISPKRFIGQTICPRSSFALLEGFSAVGAAAAGLGYGTVAASITSAKLKIK